MAKTGAGKSRREERRHHGGKIPTSSSNPLFSSGRRCHLMYASDAGPRHVHRQGHQPGEIPDLAEDRLRGDGRGLQGFAAQHRPDGGHQDPPPEAGEPEGSRLPLQPGGQGPGPPVPPEHREGDRRRGAGGWLALHRHGVPRGEEPEPDGALERPPPLRPRGAGADPGVRRAGRGAPAGHHPPRSEAGEHLPLQPRRGEGLPQGARFRPGEGDGPGDAAGLHHPHPGGDGLRHAGVHVARAGPGQDARRPRRHLLARRHPLRGAHREAALRGEDPDGVHPAPRDDAAHPHRPAGPRPDVSARIRGRDAEGAGEEPGPPLPDGGGLRGRARAVRGTEGLLEPARDAARGARLARRSGGADTDGGDCSCTCSCRSCAGRDEAGRGDRRGGGVPRGGSGHRVRGDAADEAVSVR
jgi:hypothetical protein